MLNNPIMPLALLYQHARLSCQPIPTFNFTFSNITNPKNHSQTTFRNVEAKYSNIKLKISNIEIEKYSEYKLKQACADLILKYLYNSDHDVSKCQAESIEIENNYDGTLDIDHLGLNGSGSSNMFGMTSEQREQFETENNSKINKIIQNLKNDSSYDQNEDYKKVRQLKIENLEKIRLQGIGRNVDYHEINEIFKYGYGKYLKVAVKKYNLNAEEKMSVNINLEKMTIWGEKIPVIEKFECFEFIHNRYSHIL